MRVIDVRHLGREKVIACFALDGVIVDPGPESCVDTLLEGLGGEVPRAILLTHIHFDHAGATGALVRRWPDIPVYVHRRGARHLHDPERLVSSAARLYGGEEGLARMWGEVVPVPEANLHPLEGGERILDGSVRVEYTPGHASHHVCFLHEPTGTAFTGDVCGVRVPPLDYVIVPTPPPDIDVEAWQQSLDVVAAWQPERLAITHFGVVDDPPSQIDQVRENLLAQAGLARDHDLEGFTAALRERVLAHSGSEVLATYEQAAPPDHLYQGLRRWWSQQAEVSSAP